MWACRISIDNAPTCLKILVNTCGISASVFKDEVKNTRIVTAFQVNLNFSSLPMCYIGIWVGRIITSHFRAC